jgi:hypothetical protein
MKQALLLFIACALLINTASAQAKTRTLKKISELLMPLTADDDMPGTRGASVAWHPGQKKYYAAMAGNMRYPLAVFDASGKRLSGKDDSTMIDVRGLWYNPVTKRIEGNAYSDYGWFYYKLTSLGLVDNYETIFDDQNQPTEQSVGAYDPSAKKVLFLDFSKVFAYDIEDATPSTDELIIHWGRTKTDGEDPDEDPEEGSESHNSSTIIYTGLPNAEIGALNIDIKQIELYNKKDGFLTQILKLPEDAPAESMFNFAFANGIFWLFDMEKRKWLGYK